MEKYLHVQSQFYVLSPLVDVSLPGHLPMKVHAKLP
jgi:hypothetical protein